MNKSANPKYNPKQENIDKQDALNRCFWVFES